MVVQIGEEDLSFGSQANAKGTNRLSVETGSPEIDGTGTRWHVCATTLTHM